MCSPAQHSLFPAAETWEPSSTPSSTIHYYILIWTWINLLVFAINSKRGISSVKFSRESRARFYRKDHNGTGTDTMYGRRWTCWSTGPLKKASFPIIFDLIFVPHPSKQNHSNPISILSSNCTSFPSLNLEIYLNIMTYSILIFAYRKPGTTPEQFRTYYEGSHVPLVKAIGGE